MATKKNPHQAYHRLNNYTKKQRRDGVASKGTKGGTSRIEICANKECGKGFVTTGVGSGTYATHPFGGKPGCKVNYYCSKKCFQTRHGPIYEGPLPWQPPSHLGHRVPELE